LDIPVAEDGSSHPSKFFCTERCGDHGKWFRPSGSVGNVNRHKDEWDRFQPAMPSNKPLPILEEPDPLAAEDPISTLPEQVSESAEIWIRDSLGVPRCSSQSGKPFTLYQLDAKTHT
jgi:hypothetical protein